MAKYCGKCGSKLLGGDSNLCSKCDKSVDIKTHSKEKNVSGSKEKNRKREKQTGKGYREKKTSSFLKTVLLVTFFGFVGMGAVMLLDYLGVVEIPVIDNLLISIGLKVEGKANHDMPKKYDAEGVYIEDNQYEVIPPDADSYFEDNSNIISVVDAIDSADVFSEAEVYDFLVERGFDEYPITTEYTMEGEYFVATEISIHSSIKHPIFQTYYVSPNGDFWLLFVIDGVIVASPISYNEQSNIGVSVVISEKNTVTSYDGTTNKFYETIPNEAELVIKKIVRIDSKTLDSLSIEEINNL